MVFIVGCIGLGLNIISALFLHGMYPTWYFWFVKLNGDNSEHGYNHIRPPLLEDGLTPISDCDEDSILKVLVDAFEC
jgi:zinc transporter 1